uniref:hypothetical protein n=1 Tax=Bacillus multifaciens TaxID=3068506 RepID=UPI003F4982CF
MALEAKITRTAEYFNELEVLYNSIDESAQIETNCFFDVGVTSYCNSEEGNEKD